MNVVSAIYKGGKNSGEPDWLKNYPKDGVAAVCVVDESKDSASHPSGPYPKVLFVALDYTHSAPADMWGK